MPYTRTYPTMPPAHMIHEWDDELAGLVAGAGAADGAARIAAGALDEAGDGARALPAAIEAERLAALASFKATGRPPKDFAGPLWQFVTETRPQLAVEAVRAVAGADFADERARSYAANAKKLHRTLDEASDALRDEIVAAFEEAKATGERITYLQARKAGERWGVVVALWNWVRNPQVAYRSLWPKETFPRGLEVLEYEADQGSGGAPRMMVPLAQEQKEELDAWSGGGAVRRRR
jgi:hypothetical protein